MEQITEGGALALLADQAGYDPIEDRLRAMVRQTIEARLEFFDRLATEGRIDLGVRNAQNGCRTFVGQLGVDAGRYIGFFRCLIDHNDPFGQGLVGNLPGARWTAVIGIEAATRHIQHLLGPIGGECFDVLLAVP